MQESKSPRANGSRTDVRLLQFVFSPLDAANCCTPPGWLHCSDRWHVQNSQLSTFCAQSVSQFMFTFDLFPADVFRFHPTTNKMVSSVVELLFSFLYTLVRVLKGYLCIRQWIMAAADSRNQRGDSCAATPQGPNEKRVFTTWKETVKVLNLLVLNISIQVFMLNFPK